MTVLNGSKCQIDEYEAHFFRIPGPAFACWRRKFASSEVGLVIRRVGILATCQVPPEENGLFCNCGELPRKRRKVLPRTLQKWTLLSIFCTTCPQFDSSSVARFLKSHLSACSFRDSHNPSTRPKV